MILQYDGRFIASANAPLDAVRFDIKPGGLLFQGSHCDVISQNVRLLALQTERAKTTDLARLSRLIEKEREWHLSTAHIQDFLHDVTIFKKFLKLLVIMRA